VNGTPAPGKSLAELEAALLAEVNRLAAEPPTEEELARVRNAIDAQAIRSLGSNTGIARAIAEAEALAGDWRYIDVERERLKSVSPADVARVVKSYLTQNNRTVGVLAGTRSFGGRSSRTEAGQ
jgi:predicted Zn-dependent peptidase